MTLLEFAYCPNAKIEFLATLSPEKWSFGERSDNSILKNYLNYTFQRLQEEGKVWEKEEYAIFNTGLFDKHYEPVYAYFTPNTNEGCQKWFLDGFYTPAKRELQDIPHYPPRANYFEKPADLIFDVNCEIAPQYDHILIDNRERFPERYRDSPDLLTVFKGAVLLARNMVAQNYKTAVPQYYQGRIQLLIPICMGNPKVADLALTVTKNEAGNRYVGHTCLDMEMAYNNARLIAKPESSWLQPSKIF